MDGACWNLSLIQSSIKEYTTDTGAYVGSGKTLPTSSVTVTVAPTVSQVDLSSSAADTIMSIAPGTALDTGSPVKLLPARLNGDVGDFSCGSMTVSLATPATIYARACKTDPTLSL